MPIYRSRSASVDNSKLEEGLNSIASIFKPQSAQEIYAGARAVAEREEASRLADAYAYANDPNYSREMAERKMFGLGKINGTNGYYAQDQNNATTLRTNALDNRTRLQMNAADNESKLAVAYAAPIITGEGQTATLPAQTRAATGLPMTIEGGYTLKQGDRSFRPGGAVVDGAPKPLSLDEAKVPVFQSMSPALQEALTFGSTPIAAVQTPEGPRNVTAPQSLNQAPVQDAQKAQLANYKRPDGSVGTARFDGTNGYVDTQSGEKLPPGIQTYTAALQGTGADTGLGKPTEAQGRAGYSVDMIDAATKDLLNAFDTGKLPTRMDDKLRSAANILPGIVSPDLSNAMSSEGQVFFQNLKTVLPMQLLVQSGQGVTEKEYERTLERLVPFAGEDPKVTLDKRRQIETFATAVRRLAGPAAPKVEQPPAPVVGAPGTTQSGAPPAPGAAPPVERWGKGPDGKPVRLN